MVPKETLKMMLKVLRSLRDNVNYFKQFQLGNANEFLNPKSTMKYVKTINDQIGIHERCTIVHKSFNYAKKGCSYRSPENILHRRINSLRLKEHSSMKTETENKKQRCNLGWKFKTIGNSKHKGRSFSMF